MFGWLEAPGRSVATGVCANALDVAGGLNLWLALHDGRFCAVVAEGNTADSDLVPRIYGGGQMRSTIGRRRRWFRLPSWAGTHSSSSSPPRFGRSETPRLFEQIAPLVWLQVDKVGAHPGDRLAIGNQPEPLGLISGQRTTLGSAQAKRRPILSLVERGKDLGPNPEVGVPVMGTLLRPI